jgi:cytochrome c-type biogenesis protein
MVFAIGWSPCVGTFLASALSMAASSASVLTGVGLLACYSLGLGLPFVVCAVLIDQLEGAFDWIKRHYDAVNRVSGVLLVALGVLMATGLLGGWLRLLAGM